MRGNIWNAVFNFGDRLKEDPQDELNEKCSNHLERATSGEEGNKSVWEQECSGSPSSFLELRQQPPQTGSDDLPCLKPEASFAPTAWQE